MRWNNRFVQASAVLLVESEERMMSTDGDRRAEHCPTAPEQACVRSPDDSSSDAAATSQG